MNIGQTLRSLLDNLTGTASDVYQVWQIRQRTETLPRYSGVAMASSSTLAVFNALADVTQRSAVSSSHSR